MIRLINSIGNIRIKSQLVILISITIGVIIFLQIIFVNWFSQINRSNYNNFLIDTTHQLELRAQTFSTEMNSIANNISFNDVTYEFINTQDMGEQLKYSKNLQVMIESLKISNKSISDVIITDLDLINIGATKIDNFWVLKKVKNLYLNKQIQVNQPTHLLLDGHESGEPYYILVTRSFNPSSSNKEFFTVLIYNVNTFVDIVSNFQPHNRSVFLILDANNNIVATNSKDLNPHNLEWLDTTKDIGQEGSNDEQIKDSNQSLVYQRVVSNLNWRVIGLTSDIEINNDLSSLKKFSYMMGIVVIVILLVLGLIINKSITAPITRMTRFMNSLGNKYNTRRLEVNNRNELSILARVMNKMLDNIDDMTNKVISTQNELYKAELSKKNAQFSALQSQVNPHFLYNTLDCIRSIALSRNVTEIFEITTSMARIFRYSIKENNEVEVNDELECINDYIKIIQIRQRNRFTIIYEVEQSILDCRIPKMILQPLIENAVFHGLEQKKEKGTLIVSGRAINNNLLFTIKDDGKGMSSEVVHSLSHHINATNPLEDSFFDVDNKGIGIINIDRRIKLLYGVQYGLTVNSIQQEGTEVSILLPLKSKNQ